MVTRRNHSTAEEIENDRGKENYVRRSQDNLQDEHPLPRTLSSLPATNLPFCLEKWNNSPNASFLTDLVSILHSFTDGLLEFAYPLVKGGGNGEHRRFGNLALEFPQV